MIKQDFTDQNITNFLAKVNKTETCWLWTGMTNKMGFGVFKANNNTPYKAHRISLMLRDGEIADGLKTYHRCNNKHCVNPDHIMTTLQEYKEFKFWSYVNKTDDCWLWTDRYNVAGYGMFSVGKKSVRAHRYVWELLKGKIPDGQCVIHSCTEAGCVNPDHLFLGTHVDIKRNKDCTKRMVKGAFTPKLKKLTDGERVEICELYKDGESSIDLGVLFGVHNSTIITIVRKAGIEIRTREENQPPKLNETKQKQLCVLYEKGMNSYELAERFKISQGLTCVILRMRGIKIRSLKESKNKHTIDATVFGTLTEESTYWVGFLMADGYVIDPPKGSLRVGLTLQNLDIGHIEKLKRFLKTDYEIRPKKGTNCSEFVVVSDKLGEALGGYGVVPRKCHIAKVASELESNRHFWRGMIDGDGHIEAPWIRKTTQMPMITLCGALDSMTQFHAYVKKLVSTYKGSIRPHNGSFTVMINGQGAITVIKELYGDCETYLDRKYEVAQYIIKNAKTLMPGKARGSRVGNAVLNEDIVRKIKTIRRDLNTPYQKIAKMLGLAEGTVHSVTSGRRWQHVTI